MNGQRDMIAWKGISVWAGPVHSFRLFFCVGGGCSHWYLAAPLVLLPHYVGTSATHWVARYIQSTPQRPNQHVAVRLSLPGPTFTVQYNGLGSQMVWFPQQLFLCTAFFLLFWRPSVSAIIPHARWGPFCLCFLASLSLNNEGSLFVNLVIDHGAVSSCPGSDIFLTITGPCIAASLSISLLA